MRREQLYLSDIIEAADHVADFIAGADFERFQKSELLRNILVHAYFGTDWDEVWRAARNRAPILRQQVAAIVAAEVGGPEA